MDVYESDLTPQTRAAVEFAVDMLDARDPYGRRHADGVTAISILLGEFLGLDVE
ncbi:MAG: hypothetical protein ABIO70_25940 [Pseudomonadota bacterium]